MNVDFYLERARGISVIHLVMSYREGDGQQIYHSPLDYHLHVLFYFDKENKHAGAINLDSSQLLTMSWEDEERLGVALTDLTKALARAWVGQLSSLIKNNAPDTVWSETVFDRADARLIAKFEEIQESTFSKNLKRFAALLETNTVNVVDRPFLVEDERKPDEELPDAKIYIVEDRLVPAV